MERLKPKIYPKKNFGRFSALVIGGAALGGMVGRDILKLAYYLLGFSYPGQ